MPDPGPQTEARRRRGVLAQASEEGPPRDAATFLSTGVVLEAAPGAPPERGIVVNDATMCVLAVARALGAEFLTARRGPADRTLLVGLRWGRGLVEVTQHEGAGGAGVTAIAVLAEPEREGELLAAFAKAFGPRAWGYWDPDALRRETGLDAVAAREAWRDALGDAFPEAAPAPPGRPLRTRAVVDSLRVLGLSAHSSWTEAQTAFRKLALALHPDLHGGDPLFAEHFRRVQEAHERLEKELPRAPGDEDQA